MDEVLGGHVKTLLFEDDLEDFRCSIESAKGNWDFSDFEIFEGPIEGPEVGVGPLTGSVTIQHKHTGQSRQYTTGHKSSWVFLFDTDLKRGAFSGPAQR